MAKKQQKQAKVEFEQQIARLREISAQVFAIGYFLKQHYPTKEPTSDIDDIHWGLGEILERLGKQIRMVGAQFEDSKQK